MTPISLLLTLVASAVMSTAAPLEPTIDFGVDFVNAAPIDFEDGVFVTYDLKRILPLVNASVDTVSQHHRDRYYKLNNAVTSVPLLSTNADALNRPYLYIPSHTATGPLSFWFSAQVGSNAPVYDSAFGKNFNFVIHGGIIKFNTDSKSVVDGSLKAGTPVGIAYDPARSPCTVKPDEATQTITAHWISNGQSGEGVVYDAHYVSRNGLVKTESTVTIPAEKVVAGELQVFFSCQTAIGSAWDSSFGKNWRFTVTA
ncbi:hypothetical protein BC829DRAFT_492465 [Chytridium lagenaria]|nr:hypothetical protein BC829DRAFT_492465 [Chytridium lagenaria]